MTYNYHIKFFSRGRSRRAVGEGVYQYATGNNGDRLVASFTVHQAEHHLEVQYHDGNIESLYHHKRFERQGSAFDEQMWVIKKAERFIFFKAHLGLRWRMFEIPATDIHLASLYIPLAPVGALGRISKKKSNLWVLETNRKGRVIRHVATPARQRFKVDWRSRNGLSESYAFHDRRSFNGGLGYFASNHVLAQFTLTPSHLELPKKYVSLDVSAVSDPESALEQDPKIQKEIFAIHTDNHPMLQAYFYKNKPSTQDPIFILVHGSGPEDAHSGSGPEGRDYTVFNPHFFSQVAHNLVIRGASVLMYDKRGARNSGGEWADVGRTDLYTDLLRVIGEVRRRFESRKVYVLGFSEGANLCTGLTGEPDLHISGLIFAGCPAKRIDQTMQTKLALVKMLDQNANAAELRQKYAYNKQFLGGLKRLLMSKKSEELRGTLIQGFSALWWKEMLSCSPRNRLALATPLDLLFLHGEADKEIACQDGKRMADKAKGLGHHVRFRSFSGLNHFFSPVCRELPGYEYLGLAQVPPTFYDTIFDWLADIKKNSLEKP